MAVMSRVNGRVRVLAGREVTAMVPGERVKARTRWWVEEMERKV